MVKFFCVIVKAGNPFSVRVDESDTVDDLKKAIKKEKKSTITCDADELQLSLAKQGAGWLPSAELSAIRKGEKVGFKRVSLVDTEKVAYSTFSIGEVLEMNGMPPPQTQEIHVLVELPAPFAQWDSVPGQFPPLVFADKDRVISIPAAYAENSGLHVREDGLVLYLRNGVQEEWNALLACVVKTYALLWIVGPPGTGKSLAAFAFACRLKRVNGDLGGDWDVLWISCRKGYNALLDCILFRGEDKKLTCTILASDVDAFLETIPDHTIIFLDGFAIKPIWLSQPDNAQIALVSSCVTWRSLNKRSRRLVLVASMLSLGKYWRPETYPKIPSTTVKDQERFDMYSWTLSEYQEALKHEKIFTHVMKMLSVTSWVPVDRRDDLAEVKHYVAGGSARMMFDMSTDEAETALDAALSCIDDLLKYVEGRIGMEAPQVINRLVAWYPPNLEGSEPQRRLVSSYVAKQISLRVGPERLQKLAITLAKNPAMDGHMLEMWFFSCLKHEGVQCYRVEGSIIREAEKWPRSVVNSFDPESNDAIDLVDPQMWFEPLKWNNGGFDAVFVDYRDVADTDTTAKQAGYRYKLHVRFVQVTRPKKHSYKAEFFKHLLSRFKVHMGDLLWISRVEVCFVVPVKIMKTFSIPVNEEDFRRDVVDPVTRSTGVPGTMRTRGRFNEVPPTDVSIRVIGLKYDLLETTGCKRQRR